MVSAQMLSTGSLERYRALIAAVCVQQSMSTDAITVALLDRKQNDRLVLLNLDTGCIATSAPERVDIVIVEQSMGRSSIAPNFQAIKSCLSANGAIALRRRSLLARLVGRVFSRRKDDSGPLIYGRGLDRREAALRRAGLYTAVLNSSSEKRGQEQWLLASTSVSNDRRYRDKIGRVAADYLRVVGPIMIGAGF